MRSGSQLLSDIQTFFDSHHSTLSCEWTNHRAGSQLNIQYTSILTVPYKGFVVIISATNTEKDSLSGQTVLPKEP